MISIIVSTLILSIWVASVEPIESIEHVILRTYAGLPQEYGHIKILSQPGENNIHRFFDSSPTSPSNKLVATTSFPAFGDHLATIRVSNLVTGSNEVIAHTAAWDSQVGAQVQWGKSDNELFYNVVCNHDNHSHINHASTNRVIQSSGRFVLRGAMYNPATRHTKYLECPIYHTSSDGLYGVAPNLLKIHHTQKGYGIRPLDVYNLDTKNQRASFHDGLFLTDTSTGTCSMLVTLHRLAIAAGIDASDTPMYGFHAKFSSDGTLIMFVVRTLETPVSPRVNPVRVQHLFVLDRTATSIRRMISWASYPFRPKRCNLRVKENNTQCPVVYLRDGNHPNWVPDSHSISMNLQSTHPVGPSYNTVQGLLQKAAQLTGIHTQRQQPEWSIVSFNVDEYPTNLVYNYEMNINFTKHNPHTTKNSSSHDTAAELSANKSNTSAITVHRTSVATDTPIGPLTVLVGHTAGSGHPIYHPSGKYIITDAYPKEMQMLLQSGRVLFAANRSETLRPLSVPLRLIEVATGREVWLLQMQVERNKSALTSKFSKTGHTNRQLLSSAFPTQLSGFFTAKTETKTGRDFQLPVRSSAPTPTAHSDHSHHRALMVSHRSATTNSTALVRSIHQTCPAPTALSPPRTASAPSRPHQEDKSDKSWRCDLHPAWSRDFQYVTINGRPQGVERQVLVLQLGSDLSRYFPPLLPAEIES